MEQKECQRNLSRRNLDFQECRLQVEIYRHTIGTSPRLSLRIKSYYPFVILWLKDFRPIMPTVEITAV